MDGTKGRAPIAHKEPAISAVFRAVLSQAASLRALRQAGFGAFGSVTLVLRRFESKRGWRVTGGVGRVTWRWVGRPTLGSRTVEEVGEVSGRKETMGQL